MNYLPALAEKVAFLSRPATYGLRTSVRAVETHFAWVFLCGHRAYKLKKPLRHKQLDYRSLAARERGCREEVRLNERLAPTVYRRAVPLRCSGHALAIGGAGQTVDWLIEMRRVPDREMLDRAIQRRAVHLRDIDRVARLLRRFYADAVRHPIPAKAYLDRLAREIRANEREIHRYTDHVTCYVATEVRRMQRTALDALRDTLSVRASRIVDGHGDLRAEHVCIGRRVEIIDALEFDPRLRLLDPAEEVSLLALEIERLGRADLAERLIERFSRGAGQELPPEVFAFYRSHRAATRAKLAAWHIGDPQFPDAAPWATRTDSLLNDALRYASAAVGQPSVSRDSVTDRRPTVQQRSERRAGNHAAHGLGEERSHMQFG